METQKKSDNSMGQSVRSTSKEETSTHTVIGKSKEEDYIV